MSDLFHEEIPIEFLAEVWDMMARTQQHTYQVLTKRPERVAELLGPRGIGFYDVEGAVPCPLPNVWIGVSIENARHTFRVRELQVIPAAVKFVSAEPLLGSLFDRGRPGCWDGPADLAGVDWLIVGGESGPRARPMRIEWARELRDAARAAGVAFFFKQWGGRTSKAQGRELDGRTWDEFPGHHPAPSLDEASAHAA